MFKVLIMFKWLHDSWLYLNSIKHCFSTGDFTPLRVREELIGPKEPPTSAQPSRPAPPYNGFGGEEDSLNSSQGLLPRPPKRDFVKFMGKDRLGLDGNVLRFLAKLDSAKPGDAERRFVISYFMADDTVVVFEPTVRNSGRSSVWNYYKVRN